MNDNMMNLKFGDLFKNARKMQEQMEKTRKELSEAEVVGEAGGGMVRLCLVGGRRAKKIHIDAAILGDCEMLQDLVAAAITDALRKSEAMISEKMRCSLENAMQTPEE